MAFSYDNIKKIRVLCGFSVWKVTNPSKPIVASALTSKSQKSVVIGDLFYQLFKDELVREAVLYHEVGHLVYELGGRKEVMTNEELLCRELEADEYAIQHVGYEPVLQYLTSGQIYTQQLLQQGEINEEEFEAKMSHLSDRFGFISEKYIFGFKKERVA